MKLNPPARAIFKFARFDELHNKSLNFVKLKLLSQFIDKMSLSLQKHIDWIFLVNQIKCFYVLSMSAYDALL